MIDDSCELATWITIQPCTIGLRKRFRLKWMRIYELKREFEGHLSTYSPIVGNVVHFRLPWQSGCTLCVAYQSLPLSPVKHRFLFWKSNKHNVNKCEESSNGMQLLMKPHPPSIPDITGRVIKPHTGAITRGGYGIKDGDVHAINAIVLPNFFCRSF